MKKLLLLFSLVLSSVMGAMAQTQEQYDTWGDTQAHDDVVSDLSQLSNNKVYSIIPEDWYHKPADGEFIKPNGLFGVLFARADEAEEAATGGKADRLLAAGGWGNTIDNQDPRKDIYGGWQTVERAVQKDSYDPRQQFAIIEFEGNHYLWAVAAHKFVSVHDLSYMGQTSFYGDLTNEKFSPLRLEAATETEFTGPYCGLQEVTGPRYRFFFLNEKDNKEYRIHISWAWHNNAVYQTECLFQPGENSNDGLDIFEICERGDFDPTEALTILDDYFHPKSTIVYHVVDENGDEIMTSDPYPIQTGTVVTDLRDDLKEEFYTYICEPLTIQLGENTLELVLSDRVYPMEYTEDTGATITNADVENGTFYYMTIGGKFLYVEVGGTASKPTYTLKYSDALEQSDNYRWMFVSADEQNQEYGDGCFRIFNKTVGAAQYLYYQGANVRMRPYSASALSLAMTPYGTPYGSGFALSLPGDRDNYAQISTEVEGAIQFTPGEGKEGERKYPIAAHGMKVYAVDDLPDVDVTFRVANGATVYAEGVYQVPLGEQISELSGYADELIRDFTEYEYSEPFTAMPGEVNILTATPTFHMPFKEGRKYPVRLDGMYLKADAENNVAVIDADATDESIVNDNNYYWTFRGNPYGGIEITNVGTGLHIANNPDITENVPLPLSSDAEWWFAWDAFGDMRLALYGQSAETFIVNNGGSLELSLEEDLMWEEPSGFEIVQPAPSLSSVTIGGVPVALEDGVYEYELSMPFNMGLAVEATPEDGCSLVVQDDQYGYEEYAFYEDTDELIIVSVENDAGESSDYVFSFTPALDESEVGGEYPGALSVVLGIGDDVMSMPLKNNSIFLTENSDGTYNISLNDFNFDGMLVGDIYVSSLANNGGKLTGRRDVRLYSSNEEALGLQLGHLPVVIDMTLSDTNDKIADASIEIITTESTVDAVTMFNKIHVDFVPFMVDESAALDDDMGTAYKYQTIEGPVTKASTKYLQINNATLDVPLKYIDMSNAVIAADVTEADLKQGAPENNNTIYYLPEGSSISGANIVVGDAAAEFAVNDKVGVVIPKAFSADNVTYDRAFTAGNWSTFVLPVAVDVAGINGSVYELTGITSEEFEFTEVTGSIEANKPYLIKLNGSEMFQNNTAGTVATYAEGDELITPLDNVAQIGSYELMTIESDADNTWYGYSGGKFKKANTGTIKPFRSAFVISGAGAPAYGLNIDNATGIKNVEFSADDAPAYDLQGRRVNNAKKGVFIIGGKKVILK